MARPRKDRPKVTLNVDVWNDKPVLIFTLNGFSSVSLHAVLNIKNNWVSHLARSAGLEPLSEVVSASKMLDKITRFEGPIPKDASTLLIHYSSEINKLGFELPTNQVIEVSGTLQDYMDYARMNLAENAETDIHVN